jgi:hypothetical protein
LSLRPTPAFSFCSPGKAEGRTRVLRIRSPIPAPRVRFAYPGYKGTRAKAMAIIQLL